MDHTCHVVALPDWTPRFPNRVLSLTTQSPKVPNVHWWALHWSLGCSKTTKRRKHFLMSSSEILSNQVIYYPPTPSTGSLSPWKLTWITASPKNDTLNLRRDNTFGKIIILLAENQLHTGISIKHCPCTKRSNPGTFTLWHISPKDFSMISPVRSREAPRQGFYVTEMQRSVVWGPLCAGRYV